MILKGFYDPVETEFLLLYTVFNYNRDELIF